MSHDKHHDHCQHEMAFCIPCDAPYCKRCLREWPVCRQQHFYYTYPWNTSTTVSPWTVTSGTNAAEYHSNHEVPA